MSRLPGRLLGSSSPSLPSRWLPPLGEEAGCCGRRQAFSHKVWELPVPRAFLGPTARTSCPAREGPAPSRPLRAACPLAGRTVTRASSPGKGRYFGPCGCGVDGGRSTHGGGVQ